MIPVCVVSSPISAGSVITTDLVVDPPPVDPPPQTPEGILFASDFSEDDGFSYTATTSLHNPNAPTGFTSVFGSVGAGCTVVPEGVGGSNALRLEYTQVAQPVVTVGKHLTGDQTTGYDELFIRYRVKLPDNFAAGGPGGNTQYWKWLRLFQNTAPGPVPNPTFSENRDDSHYVMLAWSDNNPFGPALVTTWGENTGAGRDLGSAGGPAQRVKFYTAGNTLSPQQKLGYFEHVGAPDVNEGSSNEGESGLWQVDPNTGLLVNSGQSYHTIELRLKLASSPTSDDGEIQLWFDGIDQGVPSQITANGGAPTRSGIPTARVGSGWNWLHLFDNLSGWNAIWDEAGVDGRLLVNDVVCSTQRIGPDYTPAGVIDNTGEGAT